MLAEEVLRIAARQDGLVTSEQVLAGGVGAETLKSWVRRGRLRPVHRGVYVIAGVEVTTRVVARAALLAVRLATAAVSDATAARLHGIGVLALQQPAHITVTGDVHRQSRPQLRLHRRRLRPDEVTELAGLRLTTARRTVRDLLADGDRLSAVWAAEAALRAGRLTRGDLDDIVAGDAGLRHAARIRCRRDLVDARSESPLETAIRLLLHDRGLAPVPQHPVRTDSGHLLACIDLAWPARRLGIEADGKDPHGQLRPVYTDRWRANALVGWQLVRFTWYDVLSRPGYVVATVLAHLAA